MEQKAWEYELFVAALTAIEVGLFIVLFMADPVDDEHLHTKERLCRGDEDLFTLP